MPGRQDYWVGIRHNARTMRREPTPAEARLWDVVRLRRCGGLRFLRQVPVGRYILDFYCPQCRLAIEAEGGIHAVPDVAQEDAGRRAALEERKITVLRLANAEILSEDEESLRERILAAAGEAASRLPPPGERPARLPLRDTP